jgi:hypothetical protein
VELELEITNIGPFYLFFELLSSLGFVHLLLLGEIVSLLVYGGGDIGMVLVKF